MAANRQSLEVTHAYRAQLLALHGRLLATARWWWQRVSLHELDRSYRAWVAMTVPATSAGQSTAVTLGDLYLARFLESELGAPVAPKTTPFNGVGKDQFGRPLDRALQPPLLSVKVALAQGATGAVALQAGINRALRTVSGEYMWAARTSLSIAMTRDDRVTGWRRVTHGNACGACLAAATGAIRKTDAVPHAHSNCHCTAEPVVDGVRDAWVHPTGQQIFDAKTPAAQDALFAGRGGKAKADLIRGGIPLERLIKRQDLALGGSQISETPLAELSQ